MEKQLKDILLEKLQESGYTIEQIRRETGISERYINALLEGDHKRIPAAPYARGYLIKLANILDLNSQALWEAYRNEFSMKSSGANDRLPTNRFALKKVNRSWVFTALLLVFISMYAIANVDRFLGRPHLTIQNPSVETLVTTASTITLIGEIDANNKLMIDGQDIITESNGTFAHPYTLQPGLNRIEFSVKKLLGQEIRVIRTVIYQAP